MKVVRKILFIIATIVCSVLVVVWHYECHHLIKEIRKLDTAVLGLSKTSSIERSCKKISESLSLAMKKSKK
jgi:hypothetical protein